MSTQAIDPVCKMTVDTATAQHKTDFEGTTYYFCAPGCKKSFERDPNKYLAQENQSQDDHAGHNH